MPNDSSPTIHEALNLVMRDVQAVGKDARNLTQNYSFRSADAVVAAVGPALREHGVAVLPHVVEERFEQVTVGQRSTTMQFVRLKVQYTFVGPQGDSVEATVWGESMDSGDKACNKALTAAFKYALCQALCIPTHEPDADASSPAVEAPVDLDADAKAMGYRDEVHRAEQHKFAAEKYKKIPPEMVEGRREAKEFKAKHGPVFTLKEIKEWISVIESATNGALEPVGTVSEVPAGYATDNAYKPGEEPF